MDKNYNHLTMSKITDQDEYLHPVPWGDFNFAETTWFGCITAEPTPGRIVTVCPYLMMRMGPGVAWSNIVIWDKKLEHHVQGSYINHKIWAPIPAGQDFDEKGIHFDNGYSIRMLKPGKLFQIDFVDKAANTEFHFTWEAVSPRFPWISDNHFDQIGHVLGYLILRGEKIEVDTYNVRDRGWLTRPEDKTPNAPVFDYLSAVIDKDNGFAAFGFDANNVAMGEAVKPDFTMGDVEGYDYLPTSWVYKNGMPKRVRKFDVSVIERDDGPNGNGWMPQKGKGLITDEDGDTIDLKVDLATMLPFIAPQNYFNCMGIVRGTANGTPYIGKWDETIGNEAMLYLLEKQKMKNK